VKGFSEAKVLKIQLACKKHSGFGFTTGDEILNKREHMSKISTGAKSFDALLQGGIETMSITEVFGEFRTGKTQLCHTLCVTSQLPEDHGGGNGKVIYIDTEGTFRPKRIVAIANRFGVDPEAVLANITYARAYTSEHQVELLSLAAARMMEDKYAIIIVDSATALFRVDFSGRGQLADRQQKLGQFLSKLTKMAEEFNVAVLISNQVVADPGGASMFMADCKKPIGGNIMAHASTTRLYLKKGRGEQRICKIYDSPCLPESDCLYQLTDGGIDSVDD
jgi:meiotic recombination protein DMC1